MSDLQPFSRGIRATSLLGAYLLTTFSAAAIMSPGATAKTPGKTYCFNGVCHRVLTLAQTRRAVGKRVSVIASFYSHCKVDRYNPCGLTSSGAKFRPGRADNAASPIYPNGTKLLVWNPANQRAAVIRIDNAGPYWRNRKLDVSRAVAEKLGFRSRGIARLVVQVLEAPTRRQATYRRHRQYAPVPGYIGRFPTIASARSSVGAPPTRIARAKIILPIKNKFQIERRIWLARMVETGPISVSLPPQHIKRLPTRLVRAELVAIRKPYRAKRKSKVAALVGKANRTSKAKRVKRTRNLSRQTKKTAARKSAAQVKRVRKKPTATKKSTQKVATAKQPAKKNAKVSKPAPASDKPAAAQAATDQPAVQPRPKMVWRRSILGTNTGGA